MRWETNKKRFLPREGETRQVSGFLFLPKGVKHQWRWLEDATWYEQYTYSESAWNKWLFMSPPLRQYGCKWKIYEWAN